MIIREVGQPRKLGVPAAQKNPPKVTCPVKAICPAAIEPPEPVVLTPYLARRATPGAHTKIGLECVFKLL